MPTVRAPRKSNDRSERVKDSGLMAPSVLAACYATTFLSVLFPARRFTEWVPYAISFISMVAA